MLYALMWIKLIAEGALGIQTMSVTFSETFLDGYYVSKTLFAVIAISARLWLLSRING